VRDETVARNYAETLFELARRHDALDEYAADIEGVGRLLDENDDFRLFLETPRISADEKKALLRRVFEDALPRPLLRFLLLMVDKRRQRLLRDVAQGYHALLDEHRGRVHVEVTVARRPGEGVLERLQESLSGLLGRAAVPHVRVRPEILGGVIVRSGDTIWDGSLKSRIDHMRRRLLSAELPTPAPPGAPPGA